jgi:capsular polysaccharide transport system permease protein
MADQATLPDVATTQREIALQRSQKVSRALQDAARKARLTVRRSSASQGGVSRRNRSARLFGIVSALVMVVLPTLAAALYFGLIASDQYQVEAQFAIHGGEPMPMDTMGSLTGFASLHQVQDSLIVVDYIRSRALVDKLDKDIDLRAIFSRPEADIASRLNPDAPIEDVVRYWEKHIYITIDSSSGIVTAHFRAFRPDDALILGRAVLTACEELVNSITRRSRQDAYLQAQEEMVRAERRVQEANERFRTVRDKEKIIDPQKSAEAVNKMLAELKMERLKAESELQVSGRSLSASAPQMRIMQARLDAVTGQISSIEKTLTTVGGDSADPTLSQSYVSFDKARLDQQWAETYYKMVAGLLEHAKTEFERQQVYLESFVRPTMPQQAEYPRRAWNVFLVALCATLAWLTAIYTRSYIKG